MVIKFPIFEIFHFENLERYYFETVKNRNNAKLAMDTRNTCDIFQLNSSNGIEDRIF